MRKKWWAGIVTVRGRDQSLELLVQKSIPDNPRFPEKVGFPGGMRSKKDQTKRGTAARETRDETGRRLKEKAVPLTELSVVDRGQPKTFFVFQDSDFEGQLRDKPIRDGTEIILPPEWVSRTRAQVSVCRSHQPGLLETLKYFGLVK